MSDVKSPFEAHDVPEFGTLEEISYCRRCGAAFDDDGPCIPVDETPCTRCGGSGGGPDPALRCPHCRGTGHEPPPLPNDEKWEEG